MKTMITSTLLAGMAWCLAAAAIRDEAGFAPAARRAEALAGRESKPVVLRIDPALGSQSFRIDESDDAVTLTGGDRRGLYYAVNDRLTHPDAGTVSRSPEWRYRYAGDYEPFGDAAYMQLADASISGYAWQWRQNWRDFRPETPCPNVGNVGNALEAIRRTADSGLVDFMLLFHLYAVDGPRTEAWFDCSNPDNVRDLIARCRLAAQYGVRHIMICADDWTPRENGRYVCPNPKEREFFGDSVGKAHGMLMKQLYEALHPEFPELELSFVGPVYSTVMHRADLPENQACLADFDRSAPKEVYLGWTDPLVIGEAISRHDYEVFTAPLTSGRKLVLWDNSECMNQPLPVWQTTFYPGAPADHDGIIFLNAHAFGWQWVWPFVLDANDSLWNSTGYDWRSSYRTHLTALYGADTAQKILDWRDLYLELNAAAKAGDRDRQETLLGKLDAITTALAQQGSFSRLAAAAQSFRDRLNIQAREITLPVLADGADFDRDAVTFDLVRDDGSDTPPALKTTVKAAIVGKTLRLHLDAERPGMAEIPRPACAPRDDTVYQNFEAVELFLQPGEKTNYGHFVFDCYGNIFDEIAGNGGDSWNPDWNVSVDRRRDGWSADVTIPLAELERLGSTAPHTGVLWRMNLMRLETPQGPVSVFAPTKGYGFHTPEFFGVLNMHETTP